MTLSNRDLLHAALMASDNRAIPALGRAVPEPEASEVESARLLANQARPELGAAGFSDQRIDELASEFIARDIGEGLEQFLRWARAEGQLPQGTSELF